MVIHICITQNDDFLLNCRKSVEKIEEIDYYVSLCCEITDINYKLSDKEKELIESSMDETINHNSFTLTKQINKIKIYLDIQK